MGDFNYGAKKQDGQYQYYPSSVKTKDDGSPAFVQPHRNAYKHTKCGTVTTMRSDFLTLTYATNPGYYGSTFCGGCGTHPPLSEFTWLPDGLPMDIAGGPVGVDWRNLETVPKPEWETNVARASLEAAVAAKALDRLAEYAEETWEREQIDYARSHLTAALEVIARRIQYDRDKADES